MPAGQDKEEIDIDWERFASMSSIALRGAQDTFLTSTNPTAFFNTVFARRVTPPERPPYREVEADVELVSQQARCSIDDARGTLRRFHGDIVNAIMELMP
jgi:NACalpha-BTF3-like transcription factor